MNPIFQNSHIQVRLPGSGELCIFPVDSNTRFSEVFRALITKGCFTRPQGEHPVWVLLCGDQDLITWVSEENTFYDRFPFEEPPIASVPSWAPRRFISLSTPTRWHGLRRFICTLKVLNPSWGMRAFCGSTRAIKSRQSRKRSGRLSAAAIGKIKAAVDFPDGKFAAVFYT